MDCTTTACENPPRHAEIEPSRLSKMNAALPLPLPLLTGKSVADVVTPGAASAHLSGRAVRVTRGSITQVRNSHGQQRWRTGDCHVSL